MIANNTILPDVRDFNTKYEGVELLEKLKVVTKSSAGVYCLLPLGNLILARLEEQIRRKFTEFGCYEVRFPTLMTEKIWRKSQRWAAFDSLYKIRDRSNKNLCFNPTHEEAAVETMQSLFQSYKDFPITFYCVNKVYRDEVRPKFGMLRTKEFIMADSYSFAIDSDSIIKDYHQLVEIHRRVFEVLGIKCIEAVADNGDIGGSVSVEFIYPDYRGESTLMECEDCGARNTKEDFLASGTCSNCGSDKLTQSEGIELAHIFQLDQTYTQKMGVKFLNSKNKFEHPYMNCSGIGVTRLLQVLVEQSFNTNGKIAPAAVSPFDVFVYSGVPEEGARLKKLHRELAAQGYHALVDLRKIPEKPKLKLADILNCKLKIKPDGDLYKFYYEGQVFDVQESEVFEYIRKLFKISKLITQDL